MTSTPGSERAAQLVVVAAAVALLCAGCFHSHHHRSGTHSGEAHADSGHGGPPPWAPAHGHRRKHEHHDHSDQHRDDGGVKVVFDSERGVYVVIGFPHHYYDAGHYYRVDAGHWQVSAGFQGPWLAVEMDEVPAALRRAHKKPKKSKKHGKPARHAE